MKKNILTICCITVSFLFIIFFAIGISLSIQPIRFGIKYNYVYEDEGTTDKKTICFYKNGTVKITSEISVQKYKISETSHVGIYVIGGRTPYSTLDNTVYVTTYIPNGDYGFSTSNTYFSFRKNRRSLYYRYGTTEEMELKASFDKEAIIWTLCLLSAITSASLIFFKFKKVKK